MNHRSPHSHSSRSAFSIIELLAVIAVVSIIAGVSVPALSGLNRSGNANRAIIGVAGTLDLARQYAVSRNTYTWVVLAANPSAVGGNSLYATILGSRDGSNTIDGVTPIDLDIRATYRLDAAAANVEVLQRIVTFPNAMVARLASSPAPAGLPPSAPNANVSFKFVASSAEAIAFLNANPDAQRVVQFTPTGQARVSGSISQVVELGLKPMKGSTPDETNVAAIQISGFTGQTQVYRR